MQTLDVISVNIWQILISLANLFLLFLIVKKFLFKPVKKVLDSRQKQLDDQYNEAEKAKLEAKENLEMWEQKLATANEKADTIIRDATENAKYRSEKLVAEAQTQAESIIRVARNEAELERKKASDGIKREIVQVSGALTEKMLEREINTEDHRNLIDSFIEEIGGGND